MVCYKKLVALKNTMFVLNNCIINLVEEKICLITKEEWSSRYKHVHDIKEIYLLNELAIDEMSGRIIVNLGDTAVTVTT